MSTVFNFDAWPQEKLQEYLVFVGKDATEGNHGHLVAAAKQANATDPGSLEAFQLYKASLDGQGEPTPAPGAYPAVQATTQSYPPVGAAGNAISSPPGGDESAQARSGNGGAGTRGMLSNLAKQAASKLANGALGGGTGAGYPGSGPSPAGGGGGAPYPAAGGAQSGYPPAAGQGYPPAGGAQGGYPGYGQPGAGYPAAGGAPHGQAQASYPPLAGGPAYPAPAQAGHGAPAEPHYPRMGPSAGYPGQAAAPQPYPPLAGDGSEAPRHRVQVQGGHGHGHGPGRGHGRSQGAQGAHRPQSPPQFPASHAAPQVPPRSAQPQQGGTGRRKALIIGCTYPGTRAALAGCVNDALCVEYMLRKNFGFQEIQVLRDDQGGASVRPTRRNILAHIRWLVEGAWPGDSLFFHFSGHGSQKRDYSGDELDGQNETLLPTDYASAGQLVDDELNAALVRPIPTAVRLHSLLDACHSGTGLDLPYETHVDHQSGSVTWHKAGRRIKGTSGGLAVQFGACKDSQTAADTSSLSADRTSTGAATFLFIKAIEDLHKAGQPITYGAIMRDMLQQVNEFNRKNGRGGGPGGGLGGALMGGLLGLATGNVGAGLAVAAGSLMGSQKIGGQTPQMCSSEPFDPNSRLCL